MKRLISLLLLILPAAIAVASVSITLDGGRTGLTSNSVIDISHNAMSIWLGTGTGAAISTDSGVNWTTYGQGPGLLPAEETSALTANNRGVWVASSHTEVVSGDNIPKGDGISFSSDNGTTWQTFLPRQVSWFGMLSYDLAVYDSMIFSACFYGGLIRSTDFGQTWTNLFPSQLDSINSDSVDYNRGNFNSLNNRFFSVTVDTSAFPDTFSVWAGSAAGINHFIFDSWNVFGWHRDSVWFSGAASVSGESPTAANNDSLVSPGIDFTGANACTLSFKQYYEDLGQASQDSAVVLLSDDGGATWPMTVVIFADSSLGSLDTPNEQYSDISSFAAGKSSISVAFIYSTRLTFPSGRWIIDDITLSADGSIKYSEDFNEAWGRYGDVPPAGWQVIDGDRTGAFNTYPDSIVHITREDTTVVDSLKLPGDFVVSLGIQKTTTAKTIWAGCRPAYSGNLRVAYSNDEGLSWHEAPIGGLSNTVEAWDFAFSGDTVYVATGDGLYRSTGDYETWTRLTDFIDSEHQTFYRYDAPFYAVDIVDGIIWAGGSDGVVRSIETGGWEVFRSGLDSDNHYAYPSPFSPYHSTRKGTTIHFKPADDTRATIKIYDMNLELVKTVVPGIQRRGGVESDDIVWDGTDNDGDLVANGVYFYRIQLDSGDDLWGKVVVIK